MPQRIQRKRSKGWRLPDGAAIVDRMTKWGNPFIVNPGYKPGSGNPQFGMNVPTVEDAIECYRLYVLCQIECGVLDINELRGKDLACWCKIGQPCHADVLLEIANGDLILTPPSADR